MTRTAFRLAAALSLSPAALLAQNQVTTPGPQDTPTQPASHFSLSPYGTYAFDADFHNTGSSVAVSRAGVDTNGKIPLNSETSLTLGLLAEYSNYRFSNPAPAADFSLDLLNIQFAPGLEYKLSDQWSLFGGGIIGASGDNSADAGDSLTYGGYVGARHKVSDALSYSFGVAATSRLEDDLLVAPLLGFNWQINEGLSLALESSVAGGQLRLTQALCRTVAVSGVVGYEYRQFRLDEKPVKDGALQDSRVPAAIELAWKPNDTFSARATAGYVLWQELEFDDSHGHRVSRSHPDPTPYLGLSANWQF